MNKRQQAHSIVNLYKKLFREKYGQEPLVHTYSLIHGVELAVGDLGYESAKKAMDYYFSYEVAGQHPFQNYLNKYVELHKMRLDIEKDAKHRAKLLEQTKRMVEQMEARSDDDARQAD